MPGFIAKNASKSGSRCGMAARRFLASGTGTWCGVTHPPAPRGGDRAGPPRSLRGSHTPGPVLNHGGRTERPCAVAERVSYATHITACEIKYLRVVHVCRTVTRMQPPSPRDNGREMVSREKGAQQE